MNSEQPRDRILWSMVKAVAEKGYESVTIADVVERASVSRSTFYEEFENKDECLFAAYDRLVDRVIDRVGTAFEGGASWPAGMRSGLEEFLRFFSDEPELARLVTVDVPAAGPLAHERYRGAIERFMPFFQQGREYAARGDDLPQHAELMAIGGAEAIIYDEVVSGRAAQLAALMPDILFIMLVPYLGPDDAAAEMKLATTVT